ncbi:YcxB family protein [Shewanella phaeophyticola]|uniref:YcxB family protein n=1 Tax=Shewanella phaeophyticola TaxID=2978345 RepID=A0ABT2P475_9GAMM|nr:YcxB family protein [Shewanella sp. KJ10-1]MCT8987450.1 YcxB family protein [Shewanella sp. KJ10-1]
MSSAFTYTCEYVLDKAYFEECFDQSVTTQVHPKQYLKTAIFVIIGLGILLLDNLSQLPISNKETYYLGYFFIGLGVVEWLSIRFKRTWWLWRQMMSKAAGDTVTLEINDAGIHSQSTHVNQQIAWKDVYRVTQTEAGFLIALQKSTTYLSKRCLDVASIEFIANKQS